MSSPRISWFSPRHSSEESIPPDSLRLRSILGVLGLVFAAAALMECTALLGSRLWYSPDAAQYITLAVSICERFDFTHELFAVRPPGYPLFLAGLFWMFGDASGEALMAVQHGLVVGTAVVAAAIAYMLSSSRYFALTVGVLGALSLHLSGYANAVLAEVTYTFLVTVCVYLLVRYHLGGGGRWLLFASLAAGCATLFKPIGQLMLGVCLLVALHQTWRCMKRTEGPTPARRLKPVLVSILLATAPGVALLLPAMIQNYHNQGRFQVSCVGGLALFKRAIVVDKMDSTHSAALAKIRRAYHRAGVDGLIDPDVPLESFAGAWAALKACRVEYGISYADAADLMGKAGVQVMRQHPQLTLRAGIRHGCSILMRPSGGYRMQPPRAKDKGMFYDFVAESVGRSTLDRYLPLQSLDTISVAWPARSARWAMDQIAWRYHLYIERGQSFVGLLDTPYEEYVLLMILGCVLALRQPHRATWIILGGVIAAHVLVSGFWLGPIPRYKIPVHPLMHIFEGLALVQVACWLAALVRIGRSLRIKNVAGRLPRIDTN